MEENKQRYYKIEVGDVIEITRNEYQGRVFYKTPIKKLNVYDKEEIYEKTIRFKANVDIPDHTFIKVLDFMEDVYYRRNDRFNAVWHIVILDYEIVEEKSEMIRNFNKTIEENENIFETGKEYMDIDVPF